MKTLRLLRRSSPNPPGRPVVRWTCLLSLVPLLALTACQPKPAEPAQPKVAGTYTLVSVDGKPLPAAVDHGGAALRVIAGTMTLSDDQTGLSKMTFVPPSGTEVVREVSATFAQEGSQLRLQWKGAGTTVGAVEGDTFTMDNEGMRFVYRK